MMLLASVPIGAQVAAKANENYRSHEGREGIAKTLDAPDRDGRQKPAELVVALGIAPGSTVVDLGTGVGYMLPYLSMAVGASGVVLAEDIQQDFLDKAKARVANEKLANVKLILGNDKDPLLPAGAADLILALDVYHHFDYPAQMLAKLSAALKPGGRLAIVEYYKRRGAMGPGDRAIEHIRLDEADVIKEIEANGFRFVSQREHIPNSQYLAVFQKR